MADTAVELLIEKLKQQLIQHAHLVSDANYVVEKLENQLHLFRALIRDVLKQSRKDEVEKLREPIRRIRNAVYDAEDTIDAYITRANHKNLVNDLPNVVKAVGEIEAVIGDIRRIYGENISTDSDGSDVEDGGTDENEEHPVQKLKPNVVVGLEDDVERLSRYLFEESTELQVYSIIGMAGMGKTILAQRIFNDPRIMYEFPTRIWVYVSRAFTRKEIFLDILKEFTILSDDIKRRNDRELADLVVSFLENERFLLVMDDLWSVEDWDRLKVALPMSNKMGRVLITSRQEKVGLHVNLRIGPLRIRFLTPDESFKLIVREACRGQELPQELECEVRLIAERCGGHPLTIVLIGGILFKEFSSDMRTTIIAWRRVSKFLSSIPHYDDPMDRMAKVIGMSYEKLPYHLIDCFLYFGMFPEDFEISAWKLIRLWIAEGFVRHKSDVSLEETAENYLQELIERRLVGAVKFKLHGQVKSCRVHDFILDFCINEAAREGFLQEVKMSSDGGFQPPVSEEHKFRRLCIHTNALSFLSRRPYGPSVRSFICASRDEMSMPMKDLSAIPKGFNLVRVLDVEPINFNLKPPRDMFQLLHLKYLFLSVEFDVLPPAFSQLPNIQTLVFNTSTRTLDIRAEILNLAHLRHFKTKASSALPETSTTGLTTGENIQTLGNISPESCTKDVFDRARNLKKLGVRGNLAILLDGKKESIDSLGKLENLEKLKLLNDVYPIPPTGVPVLSLPPPDKFPPKLKILTLSRTYLDWCQMSTIGSLENLEVLKVEDKSFVGETWEVSEWRFRRLEVLRMERLNLKIWLVSENPFPKLKHLQLRHCDNIQQIPVELADVPSFMKLELFHCKRAAASAREIGEKIRIEVDSVFPFLLSINDHTTFLLDRHSAQSASERDEMHG